MMIRVPAPGRIEYRTADGSNNPYLAAAGVLAAGLDGISRGLDPGESRDGNLFLLSPSEGMEQGMEQVPHNLGQALDELEKDDVLCNALGSDYAQAYLAAKRDEWYSYLDATSASVSQWEVDKYL